MKVPLSWLTEYVELPADTLELGRKLTSIGHMQDGPIKEVAGDQILDLEIRQNRSDCYSILGIAREVAAVLGKELQTPEEYSRTLESVPSVTKIHIADSELCYRFNAVTLDGIKVEKSPEWLRQKLEAYGMKSINNIVDITNFVMLEIGQPLHAFDRDKIATDTLVIRSATEGEELTILGNQRLTLSSDDLIIADTEKAVAIAGVMGGEDTGVSDETTSIILETASYNQASIRRTALRHDLRTEASTRLEKFLHPDLTELALRRAVQLIIELAGGKLVSHTDAYPKRTQDTSIPLRLSAIKRLGGIDTSIQEAQELLRKLEILAVQKDEKTLIVSVPYFRTDLEQEADLVEEVLRLYGYDRIPEHLPAAPPPKDLQSPIHVLEEQVRDILTAAGYDEQITEPLTNEGHPEKEPIRLQNSLTSEKVMLRTTLRNTLFQAVVTRRKYRFEDIRVFEVGKIYYQEDGEYKEPSTLGIILSGKKAQYQTLKGAVETVFARLQRPYSANLVQISQLPESTPTFYAEIDLWGLMNLEVTSTTIVRTSPPQFIFEDFSIIVPNETPVGTLIEAARQLDERIYSVKLGEQPRAQGSDKKKVFLKVSYSDPEKTLSTQDVAPIRDSLMKMLWEEFNAEY
jgi:phenylalanyl-tRNA synthetase beta chain